MYKFSLAHGIGPSERNDRDDLAGFGRELERATGLDPWLPHAWPMAAFPEAHTSDGYMPGFGGALRGFQIAAGLYPDGVARRGGPTERALAAALNPDRGGRSISADEVYRGAPPGAATVPAGRPADGGVKAAVQLQKLGHRAATAGARDRQHGGGNGSKSSGGASRPPVATVPPPRIRQPVGAGGVNAHGDLLQAQRNLARLGYASPVAGIGEPPAARLAAVQAGLRAYQEAKGLKTDGRMTAGGETERLLYRQVQKQQENLKKQADADAKQAAKDLIAGRTNGANAGPESTAARNLGARMTGAKVEAQQREAYAETRDSVKRVAAGAKDGSGAEAGANAGVDRKRPQGVAAHPLVRSRVRRAEQRADAQKQAAHRAKEAAQKAAYDADQEKSNDLLRDRIGTDALSLTPERERKLALEVAGEAGSLPSASTGWFDELGQDVERAQGRSLTGNGDTAHSAQDGRTLLEGYAYLERVRALVEAKPHNWLGVTPRWRALAAVVESLEKDRSPKTDEERVALMVRAGRRLDDLYRKSRGEHLRLIGDFMSFVPGPGEAIALVQGFDAFLDGERAAAAGRAGEAEKLRVEAAILFATAIPGAGRLVKLLHKAAKSLGAKTGRSLTALAERVKKRTQAKDGGGSDGASAAGNGQASPAGKREKDRSDSTAAGESTSLKPGAAPKDTILKLERWGYRIPGLDKAVSQRVVARMMEAKRTVGKNPTFDDIFEEVVRDLPEATQKTLRASFSNYLGAAGEMNLVFLLGKAGAKNIERTSRRFEVEDTTFAFDVLTDSALRVRKGPLGKRAVPVRKSSGMKTGTDSKLGPESDPSKNQRKAHADIEEGKVAKAVTDPEQVRVDQAAFLRQDFRELHLPAIQAGFRESLERQNLLTGAQIEQVMQNLAAYHKLSRSGVSVTAGEVFAFTIMSVAMMKALEDGME